MQQHHALVAGVRRDESGATVTPLAAAKSDEDIARELQKQFDEQGTVTEGAFVVQDAHGAPAEQVGLPICSRADRQACDTRRQDRQSSSAGQCSTAVAAVQ